MMEVEGLFSSASVHWIGRGKRWGVVQVWRGSSRWDMGGWSGGREKGRHSNSEVGVWKWRSWLCLFVCMCDWFQHEWAPTRACMLEEGKCQKTNLKHDDHFLKSYRVLGARERIVQTPAFWTLGLGDKSGGVGLAPAGDVSGPSPLCFY